MSVEGLVRDWIFYFEIILIFPYRFSFFFPIVVRDELRIVDIFVTTGNIRF
jgi:hypothetical protein